MWVFFTVFAQSSLHNVACRRYLLKETAVELFFDDQRTYLLNLRPNNARHRLLRALRTHGVRSAATARRPPHEQLKRAGLTERWQRREISTFDYLMQLNTLAGRTYVDLNQVCFV